jgi:hypothetical protein
VRLIYALELLLGIFTQLREVFWDAVGMVFLCQAQEGRSDFGLRRRFLDLENVVKVLLDILH